MEQIVEIKSQPEAATSVDEQIFELSLELLPSVGGGVTNSKV